jgi:hypothetical protein
MKNPKNKDRKDRKEESIQELEAKLTPEARALLEESREIRRKVGLVPFQIRDLIREIRD